MPRGIPGSPPHTTCTAQSAGWIWDIPLHRRKGVGHVYSSRFIDAEAAERTLRAYIGPQHEGLEANHIPMRIGRSRRLWVNNVVAIGLSGGFIEPLESTGIYLAELGLTLLRDYFPTRGAMDAQARRYNRHMTSYYDEIRDFICMHYCLTARDDSDYWRTCANHPAIPDSLQDKLEIWRRRPPCENDLDYTAELPAFSAISYTYVCAGMNHLPAGAAVCGSAAGREMATAVFADRERSIREVMGQAPDHWAILQHVHDQGAGREQPAAG